MESLWRGFGIKTSDVYRAEPIPQNLSYFIGKKPSKKFELMFNQYRSESRVRVFRTSDTPYEKFRSFMRRNIFGLG
jgi:hypothetical protein